MPFFRWSGARKVIGSPVALPSSQAGGWSRELASAGFAGFPLSPRCRRGRFRDLLMQTRQTCPNLAVVCFVQGEMKKTDLATSGLARRARRENGIITYSNEFPLPFFPPSSRTGQSCFNHQHSTPSLHLDLSTSIRSSGIVVFSHTHSPTAHQQCTWNSF